MTTLYTCRICRSFVQKDDLAAVERYQVDFRHKKTVYHYNCLVRREADKLYKRYMKSANWDSWNYPNYQNWTDSIWQWAVSGAKSIVSEWYYVFKGY